MASDLRVFNGWLDEPNWPRVSCPTCGDGALALEGSHTVADGASTRAADQHPDWSPDLMQGTFHGHLRCDNGQCREAVSIAGDWNCVQNEGDPALGDYGDLFRIRYAQPALRLFDMPSGLPEPIKAVIAGASSVIWADSSSAANRLRVAVEQVLDDQGVPKTAAGGSRMTVHGRIELFRKASPKNRDVADALLAVKWIGNDGSHGAELTLLEVLDGADVLGLAVRSLYDQTDAAILEKAKAIVAAHKKIK